MANQLPDELHSKYEVYLLDKASGLQHPVCTLTIHGIVLGYLHLCGLSHNLISLKMTLLNKFQTIVELGG